MLMLWLAPLKLAKLFSCSFRGWTAKLLWLKLLWLTWLKMMALQKSNCFYGTGPLNSQQLVSKFLSELAQSIDSPGSIQPISTRGICHSLWGLSLCRNCNARSKVGFGRNIDLSLQESATSTILNTEWINHSHCHIILSLIFKLTDN